MLTVFTCTDKQRVGYSELWQWMLGSEYPEYNHIVLNFDNQLNSAACMRHLTRPEAAGDVYVTDIDMMIFRECPTLQEFHKTEMIDTGLCYSNSLRNNNEENAYERVTGLQYNTPEWYEKTAERRAYYHAEVLAGRVGKNRIDDELMLKKIIVESGLPLPPKKSLIHRHHGIHLGICRAYRWQSHHLRQTAMMRRISPEQAIKWQTVIGADNYPSMMERIGDPDILWDLNEMDIFTKRRSKMS